MTDTKKCLHPACDCRVGSDADYCSQYCEDAAGTLEISCGCGHAGCAEEAMEGALPAEAT